MTDQFQVDDLHVDIGRQRVTRSSASVPLPKLSFDLLVALAKAAPNFLSIDELMSQVWPGLVVNPETVAKRVELLRDALGDNSRAPRYIESLRGRGYRLLPCVTNAEPLETAGPAPQAAPHAPHAAHAAPQPPPRPAPRLWWKQRPAWVVLSVVALTAVALALAALLFVRAYGNRETARVILPPVKNQDLVLPPHTVAVLPFAIIGSDPKDALLALGIAESIRLRLGTLSQIVVIEDASTAAYSGRKVEASTVGRQLNSRYLLEGTVQREVDSLRITARLVDAQRNEDVWSALFDRRAGDIFAVQDEISSKVARALNVALDAGQEQRLVSGGTNNLDAYLELLEGRRLLIARKPADIRAAVEHYRRATQLDANYSAAYSGLAYALVSSKFYSDAPISDAQFKAIEPEVRKINAKALELDPRNFVGYVVVFLLEHDEARKKIDLKRILELQPNSAFAHAQFDELALQTDPDTSPAVYDDRIFHLTKAMEIDPLNPLHPFELANEYFNHRTSEIERVEPLLLRSLELDPNYRNSLRLLGALRVCCQKRLADGIKLIEQLVAEEPASAFRDMLGFQYANMGDLPAAEDVIAGSSYESSRIITLTAGHRWHEAVQVFAKHGEIAWGFVITDIYLAMRMDARQRGSYAAARKYLEDNSEIRWNADGSAAVGIPMGSRLLAEIGLADILQQTGERARARKILQASLEALETAAVKFKRGYPWLYFPRVQALALLGRDTEALESLGEVPPGAGKYYDWRSQFQADPIFDRIRRDPRFIAFVTQSERYDAGQRALVQKMRDNGEIPQRPVHKTLAERQ